MDAFAATVVAELTASLAEKVIVASMRTIRNVLTIPENQKSFRQSIQAGVLALLATTTTQITDEQYLLEDIFRKFFADADTSGEVAQLLRGIPLNVDELTTIFTEAGYDADTLPGLDFPAALRVFEAAFVVSITEEPALRDIVQTGNMLTQSRIQHDILKEMRELVAFMKDAVASGALNFGITAETITAENVVNGVLATFALPSALTSGFVPQKWEAHYLTTLRNYCNPLDLSPIIQTRLEGGAVRDVPLGVAEVFTALYLKNVSRRSGQTVAKALTASKTREFSGEKDGLADGMRMEKGEPISAVEAIAAVPRLVILGEPGGGKSTLVNYVATQLTRRRLGEQVSLPGWNDSDAPLPVRIVLREFAAWLTKDHIGAAGDVWEYLEFQLAHWGCKESFLELKATLTTEGGIIFFDGLDEVSESDADKKRSRIVQAVNLFAAQIPAGKVVITCRSYAYQETGGWRLPDHVFPDVTLGLFNEEQIEAFAHRWYQVVGLYKNWTEKKCADEADHLVKTIAEYRHLPELAQYPLLLTLMAHVHGVDGSLPRDRAELYRRTVELLLERWDNRLIRETNSGERVIEDGLVMRLSIRVSDIQSALERVAFAVHEMQESDENRDERAANIPRELLRDELEKELHSVDKADEVIAYVQNRAGLLVAREQQTYAFPHRTFQEYLAASYLLQQVEPEQLICDRIRHDASWWREVFLLAAGASRNRPTILKNMIDELLPDALTDNDTFTVATAGYAELCGTMLDETNFAAERVRSEMMADKAKKFTATYNRVRSWLKAALTAEAVLDSMARANIGVVLAKLGDARPGVGVLDEDGKRVEFPFWISERGVKPDIEWISIPAGNFLLGGNPDEDNWGDETQHTQTLPEFYAARYPVTNAQYACFIRAGGYENPDWWTAAGKLWLAGKESEPDLSYISNEETRKTWQNWLAQRTVEHRREPWYWDDSRFNQPNQPIVGITWYEAMAYSCWLNSHTEIPNLSNPETHLVRLPTEAEWEKMAGWDAARQHKRIYAWGDVWDNDKANADDTIGRTSAVGMYPAGTSASGVMEATGNVWEWTHSLYQPYPYRQNDGREEETVAGKRVLRGGSWYFDQRSARVSSRYFSHPDDFFLDDIGFRVILAPEISMPADSES